MANTLSTQAHFPYEDFREWLSVGDKVIVFTLKKLIVAAKQNEAGGSA
jgi:hypothetical protein